MQSSLLLVIHRCKGRKELSATWHAVNSKDAYEEISATGPLTYKRLLLWVLSRFWEAEETFTCIA
jgi:hypothetical protein